MGVKVEAMSALAKLGRVSDAVSKKGLQRLSSVGRRELRAGITRAFRSGTDAFTGRSMPKRKVEPGWPMLRRTGGLRRAISADSQVYPGKLLLRATVSDSRSGNRSYHAIAGAIFFGRRDQRKKMVGRGGSQGKGGPMSPRRYAGVNKSGRTKIAARLRELLRR